MSYFFSENKKQSLHIVFLDNFLKDHEFIVMNVWLCINKLISFIISLIFAMVNFCVMVSRLAYRVFTTFSNLMWFVWYHIIYIGHTFGVCGYLSCDAYRAVARNKKWGVQNYWARGLGAACGTSPPPWLRPCWCQLTPLDCIYFINDLVII